MPRQQLTVAEELILWDEFRTGDENSYARLYKEYVNVLYHYCTQFSPDKPLIKDCIHDLFVELWKNRLTIGSTTSVRYYLMASIKRKLVRHISALQKNTSSEDIPLEYHHIYTDSCESALIGNEDVSATNYHLGSAMGHLPRRQREAIHLKFYLNMSNEEISTSMGINIQSVYNLVFGALLNLKKHLTLEKITM